jgi:hypothetical protein
VLKRKGSIVPLRGWLVKIINLTGQGFMHVFRELDVVRVGCLNMAGVKICRVGGQVKPVELDNQSNLTFREAAVCVTRP